MKHLLLFILFIILISCVSSNIAQSPYYQEVFFATSRDGVTWTVGGTSIVEHASVPDLLIVTAATNRFPVGTLVSYFVDATNLKENKNTEKIGYVYSTDGGKVWSNVGHVIVTGAEDHVIVDPSVIQVDGTFFLHYFDFTSRDGSTFYIATSSDGQTFTLVQEAVSFDTFVTDPEVVYYNGIWYMYYANNGIMSVATSSDGYGFTFAADIFIGGIPGAIVADDIFYLYGCGYGGITRASSSDGITFSEPVLILQAPVCDPSPAILSDGSFGLMLKGFMKSGKK